MLLEGTVSSIVFANEANGYTVARVEPVDSGDEMTIVGVIPFLYPGEFISAEGVVTNHAQYGEQLQVTAYHRQLPTDEDGIFQYLSSGAIKGVGSKTASAIIQTFGTDAFITLENYPEDVARLKGMTLAKAKDIQTALRRRNSMRGLMEFLSENTLPHYFAPLLMNVYGEKAMLALSQNPYLLCDDPYNLDFSRADTLARNYFDISDDSPIRYQAAAIFQLSMNYKNGNVFIPKKKLGEVSARLCSAELEEMNSTIHSMIDNETLVCESLKGMELCYLYSAYYQETYLTKRVKDLWDNPLAPPPNLDTLIDRLESERSIEYTRLQRDAVHSCYERSLTMITGGPGTGKTTVLYAVAHVLEKTGLKVLLAAPTGRAAKALGTLCGKEAKTLHRLLEAGFDENGYMSFARNHTRPLEADVVIVDEASMMDIAIATALLQAMKPHARLVLVGDVDQLPPIGAGNFFADLLSTPFFGHVRLAEIFRQAQQSDIIMNAHSINNGIMPNLRKNANDFYFVNTKSAESTVNSVIALASERIPEKFDIKTGDIQVICPSRQGESGSRAMNRHLQQALNPPDASKSEIKFIDTVFRRGDRIMQVRNNYERVWHKLGTPELGAGVYNGDIGIIMAIDRAAQVVVAVFDDKSVEYTFAELDEIDLSYAITVHKSQGSEYDAVIIPAFSVPQRLINRNLLYTAVTRAKKLLLIVGREEIISKMTQTHGQYKRYGALKHRIRMAYEENS